MPDTADPSALGTTTRTSSHLNYHVPTSASGVAELPGRQLHGDARILGPVRRPPIRARQPTFHELGHTLGLFHGGPETEFTGESARREPGASSLGITGGTPTISNRIRAELFQLDELPVPGSRAVRRQRRIRLDFSWDGEILLNEPGD